METRKMTLAERAEEVAKDKGAIVSTEYDEDGEFVRHIYFDANVIRNKLIADQAKEITTLKKRVEMQTGDIAVLVNVTVNDLEAKVTRLEKAIIKTLDENGHLADGDNCTLIDLKNALEDK